VASTTLDLYKDNSVHEVFSLASQNAAGAAWLLPGRTLSAPKVVSLSRKINPNNGSNDTVSLKIALTELNVTTGKPATFSGELKISIPKDTTVITQSIQKGVIGELISLGNDCTANAATNTKVTALIEGRDI